MLRVRQFAAIAVAVLGSTCALGQADLRLYFAHAGWDGPVNPNGQDGRVGQPQPVPEQTNPLLPSFGGRLYLWGQTLNGSAGVVWNGLGLSVELDGPAQIVDWDLFGLLGADPNHANPQWDNGGDLVNRWTNVTLGQTAADGGVRGMNMVAVGVNGEYGVRGTPRDDGFITDDVLRGHVLLGYFDFVGSGYTEIYLSVGNAGISRRSGNVTNDRVFFGFGDEGLRGDDFGPSRLPDAYLIPEPATALLLGLLALCAPLTPRSPRPATPSRRA